MADRTNQSLILYKKDGTKVATGAKGVKTVSITGLAAATTVAAGDYQLTWSDGTSESDKVDVPGFTVLSNKVTTPENVADQPTAVGADITAD
ncbi:hypothetical protein [Melissococcus plutonius]|uniref:hypothetical protein n=1 Tax=Melissococcus plutonius TaxID=33970 RepID=UPI003C2D3B00